MAEKKKVSVTLAVQSDFTAIESDLKQLQQRMASLGLPGLKTKDFSYRLEELRKKVETFRDLDGKEFSIKTDFSDAKNDLSSTDEKAKGLLKTIRLLQAGTEDKRLELLPKAEVDRIKNATNAVKKYTSETEQLVRVKKKLQKASLFNAEAQQDKTTAEGARDAARAVLESRNLVKPGAKIDDAVAFLKAQEDAKAATIKAYQAKRWKTDPSGLAYQHDTAASKSTIGLKSAEENVAAAKAYVDALKKLEAAESTAKQAQAGLTAAQKEAKNVNIADSYSVLYQEAQKLGVEVGDLSQNFNDIDAQTLLQRLEDLRTKGLLQVDQGLEEIMQGLSSVSPALQQTGDAVDKLKEKWSGLNEQAKFDNLKERDIESVKNRLLSFFSISGVINTFTNAIRSAFETVKELDAAMTEIAVVSDFSVNDMWGQLPKFTDQANKLGMAISDTYEATTLFVQQGLDLDTSMSLATETLKMAAVAGIDAAAATDAMTSALRGFNMALDETSAQRINDVYSELAA